MQAYSKQEIENSAQTFFRRGFQPFIDAKPKPTLANERLESMTFSEIPKNSKRRFSIYFFEEPVAAIVDCTLLNPKLYPVECRKTGLSMDRYANFDSPPRFTR